MTELRHPDDDLVLELALGHVEGPLRDELTAHLAGCEACRRSYDELADAIEDTLPAVPRVPPPPDFVRSVLTRIGAEEGAAAATRPRRWGTVAPAAAAAVLGLVAGVGLTLGLAGEDAPPATEVVTAAAPAALRTGDGDQVGAVSRSWHEGEPVLVVEVTSGPVGKSYTCRLVLADGQTEDVGEWALYRDRPNSWVVPMPAEEVTAVEMVAESGRVWSSADL